MGALLQDVGTVSEAFGFTMAALLGHVVDFCYTENFEGPLRKSLCCLVR